MDMWTYSIPRHYIDSKPIRLIWKDEKGFYCIGKYSRQNSKMVLKNATP